MALEDMIQRCIDEGVTNFELHDMLDGRDGDRIAWHWDLYRGDPMKWFSISAPRDIWFDWLGFGPNPNKVFGVLPFSVTLWPTWQIGVLTGGQRHGWQMSGEPSLEAGLRSALGTYLCDSEGAECPHDICEFHGECDTD
jgi:hypothetical protein